MATEEEEDMDKDITIIKPEVFKLQHHLKFLILPLSREQRQRLWQR